MLLNPDVFSLPTQDCDLSTSTPWMAVVDSTEPFNLLVGLEVAQRHLPIPSRPITVDESVSGTLTTINTADASPVPSKAPSARKQRQMPASTEGSRLTSASVRGNLQVPDEKADKPGLQTSATATSMPGAPFATMGASANDVGGTASEGEPLRPVQPPSEGRVALLAFDWRTARRDAPPVAEMCTNGSNAVLLQLPAGRHVFRLKMNVPPGGTVTLASDKSIVLSTESTIFAMLAQPSARLQMVAVEGMQALSQLIEQKDDQMETTDQLLAALAHRMLNQYGLNAHAADDLWDALLWTLEHSLDTKWEAVSGPWRKLVGHFASWLRAAARTPVKQPPSIRATEADDALPGDAGPDMGDRPRSVEAEGEKADPLSAMLPSSAGAAAGRVQSGNNRPASRPVSKLTPRARDGRGVAPPSPRPGRARTQSTGSRTNNNSGKKRNKGALDVAQSSLNSTENFHPLPEGPQYVFRLRSHNCCLFYRPKLTLFAPTSTQAHGGCHEDSENVQGTHDAHATPAAARGRGP
jgi:hypothetical protein